MAQEPPGLLLVVVGPVEVKDGPCGATTSHEGGPLVFTGPLDGTVVLSLAERAALTAAGLIVPLEDGREVVLGIGPGVVLSWPLGAVDAAGRPLPYLRDEEPIVPFAADDTWKWWRGGLGVEAVRAQLVAAGGEEGQPGG